MSGHSIDISLVLVIQFYNPFVKLYLHILAKVMEKAPRTMSVLSKDGREQVVQIRIRCTVYMRVDYWMHELQTTFPYDLNDTVRDEFETDNLHINVATKFLPLIGKLGRTDRGKNKNGVILLLSQ